MGFVQIIPGQRITETQPTVRLTAGGEIQFSSALAKEFFISDASKEAAQVFFDHEELKMLIIPCELRNDAYRVRLGKRSDARIGLAKIFNLLEQQKIVKKEPGVVAHEHTPEGIVLDFSSRAFKR